MKDIEGFQYSMSGHCKQVVDKYLELSGKDVTSLGQVATPCIDDHQILAEEIITKGELSQCASRIVLKAVYVARMNRADI